MIVLSPENTLQPRWDSCWQKSHCFLFAFFARSVNKRFEFERKLTIECEDACIFKVRNNVPSSNGIVGVDRRGQVKVSLLMSTNPRCKNSSQISLSTRLSLFFSRSNGLSMWEMLAAFITTSILRFMHSYTHATSFRDPWQSRTSAYDCVIGTNSLTYLSTWWTYAARIVPSIKSLWRI